MRKIETSTRFKQDLKRVLKGRHGAALFAELDLIVDQLLNDLQLQPRYKDHPLSGNWKNHRDCHIKPDLVLIYMKPDDETLVLQRLGSHSELGL